MLNRKPQQAGFGAKGIVGILLVVFILGGATFVMLKHDKTSTVAATQSAVPTPVPRADVSGQAQASKPGTAAPYILHIKEWGVSFPLPESVKDAYYTTVGGGVSLDGVANTVWVSLKSLNGTSCDVAKTGPTETNHPVGFIGRVLPEELEPVKGVPYKDLYSNGVMIEKYYYFYVASVNADCKSKQELEPANASFKDAARKAGKTAATNQ